MIGLRGVAEHYTVCLVRHGTATSSPPFTGTRGGGWLFYYRL